MKLLYKLIDEFMDGLEKEAHDTLAREGREGLLRELNRAYIEALFAIVILVILLQL